MKRTTSVFITELAALVNVVQMSVSTACTYMVRYYRQHGMFSCPAGDRFTVATACLFLAAKVEENPKQLSEFVANGMALRTFYLSGGRAKVERSGGGKKYVIRACVFVQSPTI